MIACLALLLAGSFSAVQIPAWARVLMVVPALIIVQLIPVPATALSWLSPEAARLMQLSIGNLGLFPAARPLSLDPAGTALETAKAALYLASLMATLALSQWRWARQWLLSALVAIGPVVVLLSVLRVLFIGGETVIASTFPIVNPNHAAALLNLAAWAALGRALDMPHRRPLWVACFMISGSGVWLTASRGGIAAFVFGAVFFLVLHQKFIRSRSIVRAPRSWLVPGAMLVPLAVGFFFGYERIVHRFASVPWGNLTLVDRISVWPVLGKMIALFPLLGIGRGAFMTTFPHYKIAADGFTWTHAENDWIQPIVELGIPGGALLMAATAWAWFAGLRRPSRWSGSRLGVLAGTAAVVLHNAVDFSLEMVGMAVPFVVALATLGKADPAPRPRTQVRRLLAPACLILSVGGIALHQTHSVDAVAKRMAMLETPEASAVWAKTAAWWHPADYWIHAAVGSSFAGANRPQEALPWLFRAMVLNPTAPEPHLLAGRCLARTGKTGAALREYRLAYLFRREEALAEALSAYPDLPLVLRVVQDSAKGLVALGSLLAERARFEDAEIVFRRAWVDFQELTALARLCEVTLEIGKPERALECARELRQRDSNNVASYTVASASLLKLQQADAALAELGAGEARQPGDCGLRLRHAQLLIARHHFAEAREVLRKSFPRNAHDEIQVRLLLAKTFEREGRLREAIAEASAARDLDPSRFDLHLVLADLLAESQRFDDAIATLSNAASLSGYSAQVFQKKVAEFTAQRSREKDQQLIPRTEPKRAPPEVLLR